MADAAGRLPIPLGAFGELIDGAQMDVTGRRYQTFAELETYCRCVAGAVGRLCLGVFGSAPDPAAPRYADALGIALQQTNILRDLREDLLNGRVYLPAEDLDRFGVRLRIEGGRLADPDGSTGPADPVLGRAGPGLVRRRAAAAPAAGPAQRAPAPRAMAGIYRRCSTGSRPSPSARVRRAAVAAGAAEGGVVAATGACSGLGPSWAGPVTRVGVVGGGLAGITAALDLADAGREVDLLEARPRLGGLASSFRRGELPSTTASTCSCAAAPRTGGCSTGSGSTALTTLQPRLDIPVLSAGARGRPGCAATRCRRRCTWPGRCSATGCCARPSGSRAARAALALRRARPGRPGRRRGDFGSWLAAHGQGPRAIAGLWDLVGVATLNCRPPRRPCRSPRRSSRPGCWPIRRPATSAGPGSRSAGCTPRRPRRRWPRPG